MNNSASTVAPAEQPAPLHEFCEIFGNVIFVAVPVGPEPNPGQIVRWCTRSFATFHVWAVRACGVSGFMTDDGGGSEIRGRKLVTYHY